MRHTVVLLGLALATAAGAADIYTWRDRDGQVHYSDTPPANVPDVRRISRSAAPAADPQAAQRGVAERDLEFRKRKESGAQAADKLAKQQAEAADRQRNCEDARRALAALESGQRITRQSASGEIEYLDDAQRAAETARARQSVSEWCR